MSTSSFLPKINKRRTFAIISHPDAGKTTITEKLLLFGGAIHTAGMVKAKRAKHFATSDWMEIEKQRGISVSSSVMQFDYEGFTFNLLDTPGHADFSEDTYRVLTAVDSALMVIDAAKGIETQTLKLFRVCRERQIPIITFVNKLDLEGKAALELIDEIEKELNLTLSIATWPIGSGKRFQGVYNRLDSSVLLFDANQKTRDFVQTKITDLKDSQFIQKVDEEQRTQLSEELELLEASMPFDKELFLAGEISPVFFGSAINNFGVQELLNAFANFAPSPRPIKAKTRVVEPTEEKFSGLIFKVQANMDPKHRDRYAFLRVCSGVYEQGMQVYQVRQDRQFKINHALYFLSQKRQTATNAIAGDIIGIHDRGHLRIGDTLTQGENLEFLGIPQFSPELFALVRLIDPSKSKQLQKGLLQLSEEGASQVFRRQYNTDMILGVVGSLQFEVVKYRLEKEYNAPCTLETLPYASSRWYRINDEGLKKEFESYYQSQIVRDAFDNPMILLKNDWETQYIKEKYPKIEFYASLLHFEKQA